MESIRLHIDEIDYDAARISAGFSSGAIIYVMIGTTEFPGEQWYDMVFTDLKTWLPGLISFGRNHTDFCVLSFMDGPFQIRFTRQNNGATFVSCMRNNEPMIQEIEVDFSEFLESVIKCVRKYDRFMYEKGHPQQFVDELSKLIAIAKLRNN